MARRPEHLLLRGNIWWVRAPDALRPIIGKVEIRRSLKTSDGAEANSQLLHTKIERYGLDGEQRPNSRRAPSGIRTADGASARINL
ncbi:MAG: hypothetical protein DI527_02620 [Chelatococcus sp.]|nr:MAG: hypothetical protein DI527_02620 [Chelatococcus sp.]